MAVTIAERIHLFPSRTQKLSSLAPKVLGLTAREDRLLPPFRIGCCRLSRHGNGLRKRSPFLSALGCERATLSVSAAQGERRLGHGFCPQWQKPQFGGRGSPAGAVRITSVSPPKVFGLTVRENRLLPTSMLDADCICNPHLSFICPCAALLRRISLSRLRFSRSFTSVNSHRKAARSANCLQNRSGGNEE